MNYRLSKQKEVKELFSDIKRNKNKYLFIHYSCDNFEFDKSDPVKIFSIIISPLEENKMKIFSVLDEAKIAKIKIDDISKNYEELEIKMLEKFFDYLKKNVTSNNVLLHWNMKDNVFGFEAILIRYQMLTGNHTYDKVFVKYEKINLAEKFYDLYGKNYINKPALDNLIKLNKIDMKNAKVFDKNLLKLEKYKELTLSFNSRYICILIIIDYAINDRLKTKFNIINRYGISPSGIWEARKKYWIIALIFFIFSIIISFFYKLIF